MDSYDRKEKFLVKLESMLMQKIQAAEAEGTSDVDERLVVLRQTLQDTVDRHSILKKQISPEPIDARIHLVHTNVEGNHRLEIRCVEVDGTLAEQAFTLSGNEERYCVHSEYINEGKDRVLIEVVYTFLEGAGNEE